MKKILLFISLVFFSCNSEVKSENPILDFQKNLVKNGITGSNTAMVYKDGKIIYNEIVNSGAVGDADITENTIFAIHSMSKTVTTVAMMILLDREMFDLNDQLSKYLPEFENMNCKGSDGVYPCENKIKVIDLLTHRSGFTYYAKNGANWLASTHTDLYPDFINTSRFNNLDDFSKAVANQALDFEPGSMYSYGLNQALLGRLVEVISNQSFYEFLKENIFDQLGMNDTKFHLTEEERTRFQPLRVNIKSKSAFNQTDYNLDGYTAALDGYSYDEKNKAHFGGEGLVSTMSDFSKFCEMLVNNGLYNDQQIISKKSIKIMTDKYTNGYPDPNEPNVFPDYEGNYMGFTFVVSENPEIDGSGAGKGTYGWSGYHNTHFWIDPQNKTYGLFMSRAIEFDFSIKKKFKQAVYLN
jgi:CubicO group peptidase (beta-lactamase class C family)|tara:strand:- start:974 stop:2206 length:1233 start_codon:yes stop_codon:yes gene_type:complete